MSTATTKSRRPGLTILAQEAGRAQTLGQAVDRPDGLIPGRARQRYQGPIVDWLVLFP